MPLGRNVRDFDIAYLDALTAAYPGASADELSKLTYRSASTITRYMKGGYDHIRASQTENGALSPDSPVQLSITYETGVEQRLSALEDRLAYLVGLGEGEE